MRGFERRRAVYREQTPEGQRSSRSFPTAHPTGSGSRSMAVLGHDYRQSPQLLVPSREFRKSSGDWEVVSRSARAQISFDLKNGISCPRTTVV